MSAMNGRTTCPPTRPPQAADDARAGRDHLIRYGGEFSDLLIERAAGSWLTTEDGRRILDFTSGQMCATLGHGHPAILEAMREASGRVVHLFSGFLSRDVTELARELMAVLPEPLARAMFLSTGGEANEAALRLAKLHTGGHEVLAFAGSWHGMTAGAASSTYSAGRRGYGPGLPGTMALPTPNPYRCPIAPLPRPLRPHLPERRHGARRRAVGRRARRRDRRADPQRGRHRPAARGLHGGAQAALRGARDAARRRRGADRAGPRRHDVRLRAARRRARLRRALQDARRRPAAVGHRSRPTRSSRTRSTRASCTSPPTSPTRSRPPSGAPSCAPSSPRTSASRAVAIGRAPARRPGGAPAPPRGHRRRPRRRPHARRRPRQRPRDPRARHRATARR